MTDVIGAARALLDEVDGLDAGALAVGEAVALAARLRPVVRALGRAATTPQSPVPEFVPELMRPT